VSNLFCPFCKQQILNISYTALGFGVGCCNNHPTPISVSWISITCIVDSNIIQIDMSKDMLYINSKQFGEIKYNVSYDEFVSLIRNILIYG
jgi:hypothetical protein